MSQRVTQMIGSHGQKRLSHWSTRVLLPLLIAVSLASPQGFAQTSKEASKDASDVIIASPVKLPDPHVPGYSYPESQATILKHVNAGDHAWITNHAWGLWTALTTELLPGVRVYETWQSPDNGQILSSGPLSGTGAAQVQGQRHLRHPGQFHGRSFGATAASALPSTSNQVLVSVNWSPEMVADVTKNGYLSSTTLNKLLAKGTSAITLVDRSVSLKPTYLWMGAPLLVAGRYYQLSTWPGPPNPAIPDPSNLWGQCVWVDTQDRSAGTGNGTVDATCSADGSSRTAANTYGLGGFIGFKLSTQEAAEWAAEGINVQVGGKTYQPKAGETVILAAMHVGTREMTEWTWQSFWWQPNADQPPAPSSTATASARPAQLKGAARHYAQCTAYQMVNPNQPITGGSGTQPVLCYNPYLEAPFANNPDLPDSQPWTYKGSTYNLNVGVQTNCMACHIQAAYPQNKTSPGYTADRYIDLNNSAFKTYLKMDFSWSIVQNVK